MIHRQKRPTAATLTPPAAHAMQAAVKAHRAGRLDEAIVGYRQVVKQAPSFPPAHYNLGVALKAKGQAKPAMRALDTALRTQPRYGLAHAALAELYDQGEVPDKALRHWIAAYRELCDQPTVVNGLVNRLGSMRFSSAAPELSGLTAALLERRDVEGQRLAGAALSLLRLHPQIRKALETGNPERLPLDKPPPLLLAVLRNTIAADPDWESLLTSLRACLVQTFDRLGHPAAALTRALADQMLATDYAFRASPAEEEIGMETVTDGALTAAHVRAALYRPIALEIADLRAESEWEDFVSRHVWQRQEERRAAEDMPRLTPVEDAVSRAVQDQYTALPYPRWQSTRVIEARPRRAVLAAAVPGAQSLAPPEPRRLSILVAGCGTGKHAVDVATRFVNAEVLAVDLSRNSLGYAKTQAQRFGITNLSFAEADILALGEIGQRFDHIEAVGVLHHLAEPEWGWQVLCGLLVANGTMKIGLYSRRGRAAIKAAQAIAEDFPRTAEGLRVL
ncbi:MAG TPA: methyltransferase domain-containing protein, partial [Alphaproteobacteria bacterium]|nr:methyltransferase domain-containing protein [Alphaproteobacteria bacterium]